MQAEKEAARAEAHAAREAARAEKAEVQAAREAARAEKEAAAKREAVLRLAAQREAAKAMQKVPPPWPSCGAELRRRAIVG